MCAVIGIFCHSTQRVNRIHILLPRTLHESVVVALTFSTSPHVVDNGARYANNMDRNEIRIKFVPFIYYFGMTKGLTLGVGDFSGSPK